MSSLGNTMNAAARLAGWKKTAQKNLDFHLDGDGVDDLISTFYEARKPKMAARGKSTNKSHDDMAAENARSREDREKFLQEKLGLEREGIGNGLYRVGNAVYWQDTGRAIGGSAEEFRAKTFNRRQIKAKGV